MRFNFLFILLINGLILSLFGVVMLLSSWVDLVTQDPNWITFIKSGGVSLATGMVFYIAGRKHRDTFLGARDSYLLTFLSWIFISIFGAMPFYFSELQPSLTDSIFESISGLTTTGSTIFSGLDEMPKGILLWRSILQWIGGIGIIVLAIGFLPVLGTGGLRLFHTESSDQTQKPVPRMITLVRSITLIYIFLTVSCAAAYYLAGMTPFEAVAHAMTTLSTGGFSTSDASLGHFDSTIIHWIAIVFMILGSLPYVLYFKALNHNTASLYNDDQVRFFLRFLAISTVSLTLWLWGTDRESLWDAFNHVAFHITSIVTTTGFTTADYSAWGELAFAVFFFFLFIGGCFGSTSSGIKVFRFQVIFKLIQLQFRRLLNPHGIFTAKFNNNAISVEAREAVTSFFGFYILFTCVIAILLSFAGLDFVTSASGAATAVANVGPGLGNMIGPLGNFQPLPDFAKWVLCFAMLAGRLELFTILVVFAPSFWRR